MLMHPLIPGLPLRDTQVGPGACSVLVLLSLLRPHWLAHMLYWLLPFLAVTRVSQTLEARLKVGDFVSRLNVEDGIVFFESLNLEKPENLSQLVTLLRNPDVAILDNWGHVHFDEVRATLLVNTFLEETELHPLVLPFNLFACDEAINEALSPHLIKYRPGSLNVPKYCRRHHSFEQERQLVLLQETPALFVRDPDRWQFAPPLESIPGARALSKWQPQWEYESPLLATLSLLFDLILRRVPEDSVNELSQMVVTMSPKEAVLGRLLVKYEHMSDWTGAHHLFINQLVQLGRRHEWTSWMQALWEGKLLLCTLAHDLTAIRDREALLESYLARFSFKDIPLFILRTIKQCAVQRGMLIGQNFRGAASSFIRLKQNLLTLDRHFPRNRGIWGRSRKYIARWRNRLRFKYPVVNSFDELAALAVTQGGVLEMKQLAFWWARINSESRFGMGWSPLIDPTALPLPLVITREHQEQGRRRKGRRISKQTVTTFGHLLTLITQDIEESLLTQGPILSSTTLIRRWARLVVHTVVVNLLHRGNTGFPRLPWAALLYDLYRCDINRSWTDRVNEGEVIQLSPALQGEIIKYLDLFGVVRIHPRVIFQTLPSKTLRHFQQNLRKMQMTETKRPSSSLSKVGISSLASPSILPILCLRAIECISVTTCLVLLILFALGALLTQSVLSRNPLPHN